ncbi:hypothetical protein QA802_39565 [Streptomyces sp. B21-105]
MASGGVLNASFRPLPPAFPLALLFVFLFLFVLLFALLFLEQQQRT